MSKIILIYLLSVFLWRCSSLENDYLAQKETVDFKVFYPGEAFSDNYNTIQDFYTGGVYKRCNKDLMISRAIEQTRNMGGDAIKITDIKPPTSDYSCYRIYAIALKSKFSNESEQGELVKKKLWSIPNE
tara:strand:+ start:227 stop:613 length:387 start_codon:yes stop_codon:yes gene_type:complete